MTQPPASDHQASLDLLDDCIRQVREANDVLQGRYLVFRSYESDLDPRTMDASQQRQVCQLDTGFETNSGVLGYQSTLNRGQQVAKACKNSSSTHIRLRAELLARKVATGDKELHRLMWEQWLHQWEARQHPNSFNTGALF